MPHDANGELLSVGDTVVVQCVVREIHNTEEYCNVYLTTTRTMYPGEHYSQITLNAKQVIKENKNGRS